MVKEHKIMRRVAKLSLILLGLVFIGMQFVSSAATPKHSAPAGKPVAEVADPQVRAILDRSCQDCHSDRTHVPWYGHVAPVSWIVSKHVSEGREMLDLSAWTDQSQSESERTLMCDAVSAGSMPLASYTMIHRKAKLSKRDVKLICDCAASGTPGN
jgi:cytochrome c5